MANEAPQCEVHSVPMVWKTGVSKKTNRPYAFYSCACKNPDGSWCSYRPPEGTPEPKTSSVSNDAVVALLTEIRDMMKAKIDEIKF